MATAGDAKGLSFGADPLGFGYLTDFNAF